MSIETKPVNLEFCGVQYHIFPNICEEHVTQIDFVCIVRIYDGKNIARFAPSVAKNLLERKAVAVAQEAVAELEYDDKDSVIDYFDMEV